MTVPQVTFTHEGPLGKSQLRLPFEEESRGTRALFGLAGPVIETLNEGDLLCVDELDTSLHSLLANAIISVFNDPGRNPNGAQLLFNTHDTNLLRSDLGSFPLRRDQVWFVEKDDEGVSHMYSLTDYQPRKAENLERGYLQGRYGAIPYLTAAALLSSEND